MSKSGHMTDAMGAVIPQFTVGDRLRKARELTGLDQGPFAEEIGVSRGTISNYESGTTRPKKVVLLAWSMRTGVPIQWLEFGVVPENAAPAPLMTPRADIPAGLSGQPSTAEVRSYLKPLRERIPLRHTAESSITPMILAASTWRTAA